MRQDISELASNFLTLLLISGYSMRSEPIIVGSSDLIDEIGLVVLPMVHIGDLTY